MLNALVTTDINARLTPDSVAIVRDVNGVWLAFAAVPAEVNGDTEGWTRIDAALREVGWSTVGVGHIPGPGIAEFVAEPATDTVWRRRVIRRYELKVGDRIVGQDGVATVTEAHDCYDEHIGSMTFVGTSLDPTGGMYYSSDHVTVIVAAGEVR